MLSVTHLELHGINGAARKKDGYLWGGVEEKAREKHSVNRYSIITIPKGCSDLEQRSLTSSEGGEKSREH